MSDSSESSENEYGSDLSSESDSESSEDDFDDDQISPPTWSNILTRYERNSIYWGKYSIYISFYNAFITSDNKNMFLRSIGDYSVTSRLDINAIRAPRADDPHVGHTYMTSQIHMESTSNSFLDVTMDIKPQWKVKKLFLYFSS